MVNYYICNNTHTHTHTHTPVLTSTKIYRSISQTDTTSSTRLTSLIYSLCDTNKVTAVFKNQLYKQRKQKVYNLIWTLYAYLYNFICLA